jgi:DNA-binding NtrC family response regulator
MNKTILLADDDASVRKMVARVLETAGYSVTQAGTGREAIARCVARQPNLVLLDLKLAEEDGWEVFEQVSRLNPMLPVIVITAWPNQYEEAVRRGIDALMEKPLDMPLLLQTIHDLLAEPENERAHRLTDRNFTTSYLAPAGRTAA